MYCVAVTIALNNATCNSCLLKCCYIFGQQFYGGKKFPYELDSFSLKALKNHHKIHRYMQNCDCQGCLHVIRDQGAPAAPRASWGYRRSISCGSKQKISSILKRSGNLFLTWRSESRKFSAILSAQAENGPSMIICLCPNGRKAQFIFQQNSVTLSTSVKNCNDYFKLPP